MDTVKQMIRLTGKYKYVAALVLIGLVLMAFPGSDTPQTPASMPVTVKEATMEENLEVILGNIQGVGKIRVLLTQAQGSRTVYVYDETSTADSLRTDAVILTDENRAQKGLVSQVIPPVYLGAVIVCQGGDNPTVRPSVVEAVCDATGLSADKITVLKMK